MAEGFSLILGYSWGADVGRRPVGVAAETDTAYGLSAVKIQSIGESTTTDSAFSLTLTTVHSVGLAVETDAALTLDRKRFYAVGQADEVDEALAISVGIPSGLFPPFWVRMGDATPAILSVGIAIETDSAFASLSKKYISVGMAVETSTAFPIGVDPGFYFPFFFRVGMFGGKFLAYGIATDASSALSLATVRIGAQRLMVRWAQETPVASKVTFRKSRPAGVATSGNTAFSLYRGLSYGIAVETNTAIARTFGRVIDTEVSIETDVAFRLEPHRQISVKIAESLNEALTPRPRTEIDIGMAEATDLAYALDFATFRSIGRAVEVDIAIARSFNRQPVVAPSIGVNSALRLQVAKIIPLQPVVSFNTAYAFNATRIRSYGPCISTNTAVGPMIVSMLAHEHDVARFFQIKQGGKVIFPVIPTLAGKRMWTRFMA